MLHVNVLPVEPTQPTDNNNEKPSFDGERKSVEKFASLVEQEMEQGSRGKSYRDASHESGKTPLTSHKDINQDKSSAPSADNESVEHKVENKTEQTQQNQDANSRDGELQENEQSINEAHGIASEEQDKESKPQNETLDSTSKKSETDSSQELLNLLAASGELLQKTQPESVSTENTQSIEGSEDKINRGKKESVEEPLKQLTQDKLSASKGEKILEQVKSLLAKGNGVNGKSHVEGSPDQSQKSENGIQEHKKVATEQQVTQFINGKGELSSNVKEKQATDKVTGVQSKYSRSDNVELDKDVKGNVSPLVETSSLEDSSELDGDTPKIHRSDVSSQLPEVEGSKATTRTQEPSQEVTQSKQNSSEIITDLLVDEEPMVQVQSSNVSVKTEHDVTTKNTNAISPVSAKELMTKEVAQQTGSHFSNGEQTNKNDTTNQQSAEHVVEDTSSEIIAESEQLAKSIKQNNNGQSVVEETLMRTSAHPSMQPLSAREELERIDAKANEQLVEQLANRVVKDNIQVQKTQLAVETIAIYKKDFANEVKEKVLMMVNQKLQRVDIQLDPPELGNMHVRVNLQNEQASVSFMVQNQQAKEALEQHIGKLKDMLSESGVDVGDANVEQQNSADQNHGEHAASSHESGEQLATDHEQLAMHNVNMVKASAVGVDFYA